MEEKEFAHFTSQVCRAMTMSAKTAKEYTDNVVLLAQEIQRRFENSESLRAVNAYGDFVNTCGLLSVNIDIKPLPNIFQRRI
jgi:hypothetical protein